MYACDVRFPGWYTDVIVEKLENLRFLDILFLKEAGYFEECMCGVERRIQGRKSSYFHRSPRVLSLGDAGKKVSEKITGVFVGGSSRLFRFSDNSDPEGFRDMVRGKDDKKGEDIMEPRDGGLQGSSVRDRFLKIDVDVPIDYYDPRRVTKDKLTMLTSLGYKYKTAEWKLSSSGNHIHIVIELDHDIPIRELFYLQFVLGDDQKRAMLNFYRLKHFPNNAKYFNVLFEKKLKISKSLKMKIIIKKLIMKVRDAL